MKRPALLISILILVIAGSVYATINTDRISEMLNPKRSFTLTDKLNSGQSGLESGPIKGKESGDMLTAKEFNRMLELLAASSSGSGTVAGTFEINNTTTRTSYGVSYSGSSWSGPYTNNPSCSPGVQCKMLDTATHDFCHIVGIAGSGPHVSLAYLGGKKYRLYNNAHGSLSSSISVECYDNIGGGGGSGAPSETIIVSSVASSLTNAWKNGNVVSCPAGTTVHNWGIRRSNGVPAGGWFYCENNGLSPTTSIQARMHAQTANPQARCEIWAACR